MLMADAVRLLLIALLAALALGGHPTVFQFCAIAVPLGGLLLGLALLFGMTQKALREI